MTRPFRDALAAAPSEVLLQALVSYRRFQVNPAHPGLQLKPVGPSKPIWSARVGRDYRAVALRETNEQGEDVVMWFWPGPHTGYDRLLKRLR